MVIVGSQGICGNDLLVTGKVDLKRRAVTQKQGRDLARKYNCPYVETSAVSEKCLLVTDPRIIGNR
jgi:hypothetical protein